MCAHAMQMGMVLVCQAVRTHIYIYIYSDKHTGAREEIKISSPNLSEGGSLHSANYMLLHKDILLGELIFARGGNS